MWLEDNNDGIKQITISKNNRIGIVQRFNKLGQPYYIKNSELNGKGLVAVWYFHYDSNNQIDKTVFAHSNIGFERHLYRRTNTVVDVFTYYSKDKQEWDNKISKKRESSATVGDYDNLEYLKQLRMITDTTELLKAKGDRELISRKKYLYKSIVLNSKQQEIGHKTFTHKRKVDSKSSTIYSKNKTKTTFSDKSFGINDVITKEFDNSGKIISERGNFHNVSYKYNGKILVEKIEYDNGKPRIKVSYIYHKGLLVDEIYEDVKSGRKWPKKYEYNEKGKIASIIISEDDREVIYKYEYLYY